MALTVEIHEQFMKCRVTNHSCHTGACVSAHPVSLVRGGLFQDLNGTYFIGRKVTMLVCSNRESQNCIEAPAFGSWSINESLYVELLIDQSPRSGNYCRMRSFVYKWIFASGEVNWL